MTDESLTIERREAVVVLHMDDGKANALSKSLIRSIADALDDAEADDDVKAVVLTGRAGLLSGGFDLAVMRGGDSAAIVDLVADGGQLVRDLYGARIPVVAACHGHAIAAGALLLLGCDVRIGADVDANIGMPEVNIGMSLPGWAVSIAVERLSRRHLQRALTHGRLTSPSIAVDVGFLDEVVHPEEVLDRAVAAATELASTMHLPSYRAIIKSLRGDVLDRMDVQIADDRTRTNPIVGT